MTRAVFLLSLFSLLSILAAAQTSSSPVLVKDDHAPLTEQCIADYNLWSNDSKSDIEKLPLYIIQSRYTEMWRCASVMNPQQSSLYSMKMLLLSGTYAGHITHRALAYIDRHGLMKQFAQEDAAGQGR